MNQAKHTPGPWQVSRIQGSDHDMIGAGEDGSDIIADVRSDCSNCSNLLAAAPDLLNALRMMVIACTEDIAEDGYVSLQSPDRKSMRDALAAIAKATGGQA